MSGGDHGHIPVMADRIIDLLTPAVTRLSSTGEGAVVVDATLGAGGHPSSSRRPSPGSLSSVSIVTAPHARPRLIAWHLSVPAHRSMPAL